jgi:hypothetical protein
VELRRYLQASRDRLVSVLDGLDEHDVRRPLTPTGTNLLGLVKHLIGIELGYLGSRSPSPNTTAGAARLAIHHDLKNPTVQELTTLATGNIISKGAAGRQAVAVFPDWAALVERCLAHREGDEQQFTVADAKSAVIFGRTVIAAALALAAAAAIA